MIEVKKEGEWFLLRFKYSEEILEQIRKIPGRRWDGDNKQWAIPVEHERYFMELGIDHLMVGDVSSIIKTDTKLLAPPEGYVYPAKYKTKPFIYQEAAQWWLSENKTGILADQQGLGKTKIMIDHMRQVWTKESGKVLVVAKASLIYNWKKEIEVHGDKWDVTIVHGTASKRIDLWLSPADIYIVSYDSMKRDVELVNDLDFLMAITDEAHTYKNPSSQVGKAVHKIKAKYRYALTGTPIINRPQEVYNPLKWVKKEGRSYYVFMKTYCTQDSWGSWKPKLTALPELRNHIQGAILRREKSDIEGLIPFPKIRQNLYVDMTKEQRRVYNQVRDNMILKIDSDPDYVTNPLTALLRLKQVSDGLVTVGGKVEDSGKLKMVKELLEDICTEGEEKILIFSQFTAMVNSVFTIAKEMGLSPVLVDGSVKPSDRAERVEAFQTNPSIKVFVGQSQACREGLTLTAASTTIMIDKEWAPAYVEQLEDRNHRIGTKATVNIINLISENSVDSYIEKILEDKGELVNSLIGNGTPKDNKSMLNDILRG